MNRSTIEKTLFLLCSTIFLGLGSQAQYSPTPVFQGKIGKTTNETKEWYPNVHPAATTDAPNVVWILIDDIGYGATSTFGGLIETPNLDRLANEGLRYTNWHSTAFCAPSRAALLTGRNPHSVHLGYFASESYGTPGYDGYMPFEKATVAEILRENGYSTFAVGKYHVTSPSDATAAGPFNRWPTGRGFDHYFGYKPSVGGSSQWNPLLYRDTQQEPRDPQGRHATELFANEAIRYIGELKEVDPKKPFFLYFAPGATHTPHQVGIEWVDQYKGKFDKGWDWYREEVLVRQKKLGVIPQNVELGPQNPDVRPWNELTRDEQKVASRLMENYAGFVSHTDHEIGRVIDYIEQIGQLENTLIVLMIGDNGTMGASPRDKLVNTQPTDETVLTEQLNKLEFLGTAKTSPNYPGGWAAATNTPFRYYKENPCWEGGTHNGLVLFFPKSVQHAGGIRTQYTYISDILPTTLELTGAEVPKKINGYQQEPIEGISLAYSIDDPQASERHRIQYYETSGSYALYKDGWKVSFPNDLKSPNGAFREPGHNDVYLFNMREDFNETNNLASQYPKKVKELQKAFEKEARKYNVYPLKNKWETTNPYMLKYYKGRMPRF
ncbi:arylsulfatase [Sphingobacterium sp. LRF_L2]|uniref:arylsulfatase n=1 Tax=Sphingobacterium sp. LRF_L2 TaxID=3369421 RepID=UPI003F632A4A